MSDQIDDNFFIGIDSVFPYLQNLKIFLKDELSDRALDSMSKLKYLRTLVIRRFGGQQLESITDSGFIALLKGCHRLQTVFIFNTLSLSEVTFNELYGKASENPRIFYKYYLPSIFDNKVDRKLRFDSHNFENIYIAEDINIFNRIRYNFN